jgi:biotin-dependent carboxylase-like uncharacterized protein
MSLHVTESGIQTTVQDRGRSGYYSLGIPPSGAQDQYAYRIGNRLLKNDENAAALELTAMGGTYEFDTETAVAITGADFAPELNGEPVPNWEVITVEEGDVLDFTRPPSGGYRTYLCVDSGIDVPEVLGSKSTFINGMMGGHEGRPLEDGDEVDIRPSSAAGDLSGRRLADPPDYPDDKSLRFIFGCEDYRYTEEAKENFLDWEWKTNSMSDRVAYRLNPVNDDVLDFVPRERAPYGAGDDPSNVVDGPYPIGSIHIPGGAEPILLANDAVSAGGYATIGTLASIDLNMVGQTKPGDIITFERATPEEAIEARREWKESIKTDTIEEA